MVSGRAWLLEPGPKPRAALGPVPGRVRAWTQDCGLAALGSDPGTREIKAFRDRLGLFTDRLGLFTIPVGAFRDRGIVSMLFSRVFSVICRAAATVFFTIAGWVFS